MEEPGIINRNGEIVLGCKKCCGAGHVLTVLLTSMDPMLVNCCRSGLTTGRLISKTNIAMTAIRINPFIAIQLSDNKMF